MIDDYEILGTPEGDTIFCKNLHEDFSYIAEKWPSLLSTCYPRHLLWLCGADSRGRLTVERSGRSNVLLSSLPGGKWCRLTQMVAAQGQSSSFAPLLSPSFGFSWKFKM